MNVNGKEISASVMGRRLTQRMDEVGSTTRELVAITGISQQYISELRRGTRECSFSFAVALAAALDVSVEWLCGLSDSVSGATVEDFTASTGLGDAALYGLRAATAAGDMDIVNAANILTGTIAGRDALRVLWSVLGTLTRCAMSDRQTVAVQLPDGSTDEQYFETYSSFVLGGQVMDALSAVAQAAAEVQSITDKKGAEA